MKRDLNDVEVIELASSDDEITRGDKSDNHESYSKSQPNAHVNYNDKQENPTPISTTPNDENQDRQSSAIDNLLSAYERCYEKLTSLEMSMTPQQCRRWLILNRKTTESSASNNHRPQTTEDYTNRPATSMYRSHSDYQSRYNQYDYPRASSSNYRARPKARAKPKARKKAVKKRASTSKKSVKKSYVTKSAVAASKAKMMARTANSAPTTSSSSSTSKSKDKPTVKVKTETVIKVKSEPTRIKSER